MNPVNRLKISHKILLLIFLVSCFSTVAYTYRSYRVERRTIIDGLDAKLLVAAYSVDHILPAGWHDRTRDAHSIPTGEFMNYLRALTESANRYHVRYIYAMIKAGKQIVFTCSSATVEELKTGTYDHYFQAYESASEALLETFLDGQIHFDEYTDKYGHFRSVFIPLRSAGGRRYVVAADIPIQYIQDLLQRTLVDSLGIGLTIFVMVFLFGFLLINMISGPIRSLSLFTRELVSNEFRAPPAVEAGIQRISDTYHDEVGNLAGSFIFMERELQDYIGRVKEATAARERIESELRVGREIQMSVLPQIFPPFPQCKEFDLYAHIEPAKEMSGDFFDFYMIDTDHLYFTLGDVSGKGVPASLMMVTCRTLLEAMANDKLDHPNDIIDKVNFEISRKNEALLFVTVFYCILNIRTGLLRYANAGHNLPYLLKANGDVAFMGESGEPAIGVIEDFEYSMGTLQLQPGDCVFLYTDGVNEAMSIEGQEYSEARLEEVLKANHNKPMTELVRLVVADVKKFAEGAPQSDDITTVAMRWQSTT